jgi:hypothetical protein
VTNRKHTPIHDFWHRRVEGQIRDAIYSHPEWFNVKSETQKRTLVNSLAKRIVGEIVAASFVATKRAEVASDCLSSSGSGGGAKLPPDGGDVGPSCVPSEVRIDAETRFRQRFEADKADEMTEEEWGQWVDRLPKDEFWAMMELGLSEAK